jgi:hypothetical protein
MDLIAQQVADGLFVTANHWCSVYTNDPELRVSLSVPEGDLATIHCCKHPCWLTATSQDNIPPSYLVYEKGEDLYLNMIDPDVPFFQDSLFVRAALFIDKHLQAGRKVIIHCNQGVSRSPSVALVYMARKGMLPIASYNIAKTEFEKRFPLYNPGLGIQTYFRNRWEELTHVWPGETAETAPIEGR